VDRLDAEDQADPRDRVRDRPVERVRTSGRAFERLVDHLALLREDGCDRFFVQHIQAPSRRTLAARGERALRPPPEIVSEIGPVIGAHAGPG
jgi:fatty acid-binding protein DegV